jgi:hypothetical protein
VEVRVLSWAPGRKKTRELKQLNAQMWDPNFHLGYPHPSLHLRHHYLEGKLVPKVI